MANPVDEEHVNPGWMLMPVGNLVGAVAARPVDEEYVEWGWFLFSVGVLLWLALWPVTFHKVRGSVKMTSGELVNRAMAIPPSCSETRVLRSNPFADTASCSRSSILIYCIYTPPPTCFMCTSIYYLYIWPLHSRQCLFLPRLDLTYHAGSFSSFKFLHECSNPVPRTRPSRTITAISASALRTPSGPHLLRWRFLLIRVSRSWKPLARCSACYFVSRNIRTTHNVPK